MAKTQSRYESRPKQAAPRPNPIILGPRSAFWLFWCMVAVIGTMIVGAVGWLLAHPVVMGS